MLSLFGSGHVFQLIPSTSCHISLRLPRNVTLQRTCNVFPAPATQSHAPTLPGCFNHLPPNVTLVLRLPHNVTLQRTCNVPFPAPATQSHSPTLPGCFNRLRLPPNVTLVLRLPHNVTIQRTIPCTSHTDPRCNWKCHVYKRANFTCTSEPISRVQANPRPSESTCLFSCVFLRLLSISKRISKPRALLQALLAAWQGRHQLACRDALQQVLFSLNMFTLQLALQGSAPRKLMTFGCFCSCFHHAVMHQNSQRFKGLIIRNHSNKCEGWNFWYPRFSIGSAPSRRSCICENAARSFLATPVRSGNSYERGRQTHNRRHSHADIKSQNPRKICWFASKQSRKKSDQIADGLCDLMGGENPGGVDGRTSLKLKQRNSPSIPQRCFSAHPMGTEQIETQTK